MRETKRSRKYAKYVGLLGATVLAISGYTMIGTETATASKTSRLGVSPQWRDGRFRNPLPEHRGSMIDIARHALKRVEGRTPDAPVGIVPCAGAEFTVPPSTGLRITWFGHSSFLIEIDGSRVLLDPVWSDRASPVGFAGPKRFFPPPLELNEIPEVDAVVISHDHYDHLDEATIRVLGERGFRFVVPLGVGSRLTSWGIAPGQITELDWWEETSVGTLTFTATPARHFSGRSVLMLDANKTLWSGWSIQGPSHRVYYSGDTAMFPGFAEIGRRLGPFDAHIIEIGAYDALWPDVHIGPEQAFAAHMQLGGGLLIPSHWGTFNLANHSWTEPVERLLAAVEGTGSRILVPRPGESIEPALPDTLVRWWPEVPWRVAAETPIVSTGLSGL